MKKMLSHLFLLNISVVSEPLEKSYTPVIYIFLYLISKCTNGYYISVIDPYNKYLSILKLRNKDIYEILVT